MILNPSGIMGPNDHGPSRIGRTLLDFARGRFPMVVPEFTTGSTSAKWYRARFLPSKKGQRGHKYILGGEVGSIRKLAELVAEAGGKRAPRYSAPLWLLAPVAPVIETRHI